MENKFLDFPAELKAEESGYFKGYASTFGGAPDQGGDVVLPGAFANSLVKGGYGGRGVKMLWQHDSHNPIGVWDELVEDSKGLKVAGQLAIKATQGKDAYELMKMGALDGLSIGYDTVIAEAGKGKIKRYLKQLDLYEISPVTFAMNPRASITQVKAAIELAQNEKELEEALREAGMSNSAAKYMVSQCKHVLLKGLSDSDSMIPAEAKPYPNEHACRLEDPSQFDSFARRNNAATVKGKSIDYIFGIKAGKSTLQAMRFSKDVWTTSEARAYCAEKGGIFETAKEQVVQSLTELITTLKVAKLK